MISKKVLRPIRKSRREKGGALVIILLLMVLLITACGAIILVTSLGNSSTVDAVAEKQAFRAAEAGMQMTLNVLRGNGSLDSNPISFKRAGMRIHSNKGDDWVPFARLSKYLTYNYPATLPDRVTLTPGYTPNNGLAYSVMIQAPDAAPAPTPNPTWVDEPVVKPIPAIKPPKPDWHPWHCSHCSWDYTHCRLYNPPANGTVRSDGIGCAHNHCIPPAGWNGGDDGFQRLLVKVTGYGPRGARKEMEMMVKRVIFDYYAEPLIYVNGSTTGTPFNFPVAGIPEGKFDGDSSFAFNFTNLADETLTEAMINLPDKITSDAKADVYETNTPDKGPKWLESPAETKSLVSDLEEDARLRDRWFTSYPTGNAGAGNPQITFVRGNAQLTSHGEGLLIVTGKLTLNSSFTFKGLILVLGDGELEVTGGNPAKVEGAVVLAKFDTSANFLAPTLRLNAPSKFEFKYVAANVQTALKLVNLRVMSVREL